MSKIYLNKQHYKDKYIHYLSIMILNIWFLMGIILIYAFSIINILQIHYKYHLNNIDFITHWIGLKVLFTASILYSLMYIMMVVFYIEIKKSYSTYNDYKYKYDNYYDLI